GDDKCCEDAEVPGYTCNWALERIVLPAMNNTATNDQDEALSEEAEDVKEEGQDSDNPLEAAQSMMSGGGMAQFAMQLAYPALKPAIEASVRRATVTVHWSIGSRDMSFDVVQYLVGTASKAANQQSIPITDGTTQ